MQIKTDRHNQNLFLLITLVILVVLFMPIVSCNDAAQAPPLPSFTESPTSTTVLPPPSSSPSSTESPTSTTVLPPPSSSLSPAESPTPKPQTNSGEIFLSEFGPMTLYKGQRIRLSVCYPADWIESAIPVPPPNYPLTLRHSQVPGTQLTITEPSFADLGQPVMTLDDYAKKVIATNQAILKEFSVVTETYVDLTGGAQAKLIVFSVDDDGLRIFYRLIYVQDNLILNFTYTYRPALDNIASLIKYSFDTLRLDVPSNVSSVPDSALMTASEYLERGIGLLNKGDFINAISDFTKAIELDPNSAEAYFYRAGANTDSGNYENAIADFTKSIDLDPKHGDTYYSRGCIYSKTMQVDKAIADYTKAIELNAPHSPEAYFNRSKSYSFKYQFDKAISDLTDAIKLRPEYVEAYDERAIVYAMGFRQFDKAIQDHAKVIELDPEWAKGYFNRGITYLMMEQPSLAAADFNKVIEISNDPLQIANAKDMLSRLPK